MIKAILLLLLVPAIAHSIAHKTFDNTMTKPTSKVCRSLEISGRSMASDKLNGVSKNEMVEYINEAYMDDSRLGATLLLVTDFLYGDGIDIESNKDTYMFGQVVYESCVEQIL